MRRARAGREEARPWRQILRLRRRRRGWRWWCASGVERGWAGWRRGVKREQP
jgi:hypothetical protein